MTEFSLSEFASTNPTDPKYLSDYLPEWHLAAACRGMDPDLFFPQRGESTKKAKATCASCPVRQECFDWALENNPTQGIWGGVSYRVRREIKKERVA